MASERLEIPPLGGQFFVTLFRFFPLGVQGQGLLDAVVGEVPFVETVPVLEPSGEAVALSCGGLGPVNQFGVHVRLGFHRGAAQGVEGDGVAPVLHPQKEDQNHGNDADDNHGIQDLYGDFHLAVKATELRFFAGLVHYFRTRYFRISMEQAIRMIRPLTIYR